MPAYDKVPCEYCGEEVSLHPMSQKKHKRECKMSPEVEIKKEVTQVVEPKIADRVPVKPEEAELYRIATQALEKRKQAPELYVAGVHSDERRELVKRYAPECVDPVYRPQDGRPREFAEFHEYFCPKERAQLAAHKGYMPVLDENGEIVQHEGDMLFKLPRDMWMLKQVAESNESKLRREAQTDTETEQLNSDGGFGTAVTSERMTEKLN